jgi:dTDP-4-dehydrorhamnose reductase
MENLNKPVVLVTGKNGQLGSELADLAPSLSNNFTFSFLGRDELDISNEQQVKQVFNTLKPAFVINCGAYTAVDKAETEKEKALAGNAYSVGIMASLCKQLGAKFIHISTDYVFNGLGTVPYREDDATDPVNYYGYTKLQGEKLALQNNENSIVIRTSWVYSKYGNNFVKTMIRLMKERPEIRVVSDQVGSPTYAKDLAEAIIQIIEGNKPFKPGIYHFSNEGVISWFDFATAIQQLKHLNSTVSPIPTSAFPTPAKRPAYSVMSKDKIAADYGITVRNWKDALIECLEKL